MKPVLMIHEFREEFLDLPLENYVLTFDDGLFSQYCFYERIKHIPTEKIFFISSGIICEGTQSSEFPPCQIAHEKAFAGNKEDYMTIDQIKELLKDPWVSIGGHSHAHLDLNKLNKFTHKIMHIVDDTKTMFQWFKDNLGFKPTKFCFPYNNDLDGSYRALLKNTGITDFYGKERTAIESVPKEFDSKPSREDNTV